MDKENPKRINELLSSLAVQCRGLVQEGTDAGDDFPQWSLEMYEAELKKAKLFSVLFFEIPGAEDLVVKNWNSDIQYNADVHKLTSEAKLHGFVFFHRLDTGIFEVGFLGIRNKGSGIGQRLMGELVSFIRQNDESVTHKLLLEVRTDNGRAARFYEKQGFRQVGYRNDYYPDGCDARLLELSW